MGRTWIAVGASAFWRACGTGQRVSRRRRPTGVAVVSAEIGRIWLRRARELSEAPKHHVRLRGFRCMEDVAPTTIPALMLARTNGVPSGARLASRALSLCGAGDGKKKTIAGQLADKNPKRTLRKTTSSRYALYCNGLLHPYRPDHRPR